VTVPVARGSARRTVRVAVALIAGQAALCAVIGYLTLGGPHLHPHNAPVAPNPLAGGPIVVPPAQVIPPSAASAAPKPPRVPTTRTTAAGLPGQPSPSAVPNLPRVVGETSPPAAHPQSAAPPAVPSTNPPPSVGGGQLATPKPTDSAGVQQGVEVGDPCSPVGANGVTTDGQAVRCVRDVDGQLRWVLV
jgi:hypothetical protein